MFEYAVEIILLSSLILKKRQDFFSKETSKKIETLSKKGKKLEKEVKNINISFNNFTIISRLKNKEKDNKIIALSTKLKNTEYELNKLKFSIKHKIQIIGKQYYDDGSLKYEGGLLDNKYNGEGKEYYFTIKIKNINTSG